MICMAATKDRDELVLANLGLCYFVAQRMVKINPIVRQMGYDEAVSFCQLSIIDSAAKYNPEMGTFGNFYVAFTQRKLIRHANLWCKDQCKPLVTESLPAPESGSHLDTELAGMLLESITGRDLDIVQRRYGFDPYDAPQETREIATVYGVSPQRIVQVLRRAVDNMRQAHAKRSRALKAKNTVAL